MANQRRRLATHRFVVAPVLPGYTVSCRWGMATIEGQQRTFIASLEVVVETFTTTGYGVDAGSWDSTAMLATRVTREVDLDVRTVVRAQETESVGKLYRAAADYVLALASVGGRTIASTVLEEEPMTPQKRIEIVRTAAPNLTGQTLAEADIRNRTGCTVVAIDRECEVLTDIRPDTTVRDGDTVVVAGTGEAMVEFGRVAQ